MVDEVFVGEDARRIWRDVQAFAPRGAMRAACPSSDTGWVAAIIDIGDPPTPYRFLYFWLLEDDGWRIVVSHDAVSRGLANGSVTA